MFKLLASIDLQRRLIQLMTCLLVVVCAVSANAQKKKKKSPLGNRDLKIMTFNAENLFDTQHDEGKRDWTFTPKNTPGKTEGCQLESKQYIQACLDMDWTEEKLKLKISQIKKLIQAAGPMPDAIGLQEVENENVVRQLASALGYKYIFEEGRDPRGIDVALLYKEDKLIYVTHLSRAQDPANDKRPTRDILAGFFHPRFGNQQDVLGIYVNHWPAQMAPDYTRVNTAKKLKRYISEDKKRYGNHFHAVAMGDFNTGDDDWPHPHRDVLTNPNLANPMIDLLKKANKPSRFPLGSYFYPAKMQWQHLDKFFGSQNLLDKSGVEFIKSSYRVHSTELGTRTYEYRREGTVYYGSKVVGIPNRYNNWTTNPSEAGFSDHFPVSIRLKVR